MVKTKNQEKASKKQSKPQVKSKVKKLKKLDNPEKQAENQEKNQKQDYEQYRWFYTSGKKLVIGGKNAEQNEKLVKELINSEKKYIVMHTKLPSSPFAIIQSENPNEKDLEETAIFTACFSQRWKEKTKKTIIDIFEAKQIYKTPNMKKGTFGVKPPVKQKTVELKLYLTKQKNKLRAVPQQKANALIIYPGKTSKEKIAQQLAVKLDISHEEVLQALPTGGSKICTE